jgi:hypothetical protein
MKRSLFFERNLIPTTVLVIVCLSVLSSCNVTRTVTTKSEYRQHGDTSIVIQTKTVETYDASKKM